MATIINSPADTAGENSATGVVVGVLIALLIIILLAVFGLPYLRNRGTGAEATPGANINVTLPGTSGSNSSGNASTPSGSANGAGSASY